MLKEKRMQKFDECQWYELCSFDVQQSCYFKYQMTMLCKCEGNIDDVNLLVFCIYFGCIMLCFVANGLIRGKLQLRQHSDKCIHLKYVLLLIIIAELTSSAILYHLT